MESPDLTLTFYSILEQHESSEEAGLKPVAQKACKACFAYQTQFQVFPTCKDQQQEEHSDTGKTIPSEERQGSNIEKPNLFPRDKTIRF